MKTWKLSTQEKKSVTQREIWAKGDVEFIKETGYRWGSVLIAQDKQPNIKLNNDSDKFIDVYSLEYDVDINLLDDNCCELYDFPDSMSIEEQQELEDSTWLEGLGWEVIDYELLFYGPLTLEEEI